MNYASLGLWGFWGFYSSVGLTSVHWLRRCFLVGEILFKSRILRSSSLIGLFFIRVKRGAQDISLYTYACRPSHVELVSFIPSASLLVNAFWSFLFILTTFRCTHQSLRWIVNLFRGVYGHVSRVVSFHKFVSFTSRISTYHSP